ncbi:MAG: hypothetical protein SGCHY_003359 [Lobulomycetales sp.]
MDEKRAFLDVSIDGEPRGRLVFQLYSEELPNTCKNFYELVGEQKYCDSPFHRIIPGFMCQGGKLEGDNAVEEFADEGFTFKHDKRGILSMANAGKDTNGSQFFILFEPGPHLDGKHVVFGHLVSGFDLLSTLENVETGEDDEPKVKCVISHCGILVKKTKKKKKKKSRKRSLSKSSASSREDKRSKLIKDVEGGELSDPEEEEDPGIGLTDPAAKEVEEGTVQSKLEKEQISPG